MEYWDRFIALVVVVGASLVCCMAINGCNKYNEQHFDYCTKVIATKDSAAILATDCGIGRYR